MSAARFGQKMGGITIVDAMLEVLSDPFDDIHMGITAENVAQAYGIDREAQECLPSRATPALPTP